MAEHQPHTLPWAIAKVGKALLGICLAVAVIGIPGGWLYAGKSGLIAGVLATVITVILAAVTWAIDKTVMKVPDLMMSLIFGGYVGKLLVILLGLIVVKKTHIADPIVMFAILVVTIIGLTIAQVYILAKSQVMIVDVHDDKR